MTTFPGILGSIFGTQPKPFGGMENYANAIAAIESAGSGGYRALGPKTKTGDRAYGRYQVMGSNIPAWTEKHFGRRMTPQEFLAEDDAQDAVFQGEFGGYVEKYGNPQDAASMWFSGKPMAAAGNRSDGYTTVPEYIAKFNAGLGVQPTTGDPRHESRWSDMVGAPGPTAPQPEPSKDINGLLAWAMMQQEQEQEPEPFKLATWQPRPGFVAQKRDYTAPYQNFMKTLR